ncbi:MAG: betaine--homocysteine S-methyltransferase [Luminiphilus sp.]|nr:betaine--homocysteine S-methyltransferase [Luminiphilus sp.]
MSNTVEELIAANGWCVADGATGSNFFGRGLEAGYPPDLWCMERPEEVLWLHGAFLEAGADIILTNSFGANAPRLKLHRAEGRVSELNVAAAELARKATRQHFEDTGRRTVVAGSMGPTGELFEPMGELTHEQTVQIFAMQANALAEGGAEVIWIETMSSTEEVAAAAEAGRATGLPVCATLTFDTARRSMMGITPADYAQFATQIGLDMAGSNCGVGPAELMDSTQGLIATGMDIPIVAKGNCGIPQYVDGAIHFHGSPELMAQYALFARDAGATIIGGCCGTTPEHIAAMVRALNTTAPRRLDSQAMSAALGEPWAALAANERSTEGSKRRSRRRRV